MALFTGELCGTALPPPPGASLPFNTVLLNVYDIVPWNVVLAAVGLGVHHTGVQVYGVEIAYGRTPRPGPGVFTMRPKQYPPHRWQESLVIGQTPLPPAAVGLLVAKLAREWLGHEYHLIKKNCNVFTNVLLRKLLAPQPADFAELGIPPPMPSAATATAPPTASSTPMSAAGSPSPPLPRTGSFDGTAATADTSALRPWERYSVDGADETPVWMGPGRDAVPLPPAAAADGATVGAPLWTNRIARAAERWLPARWLEAMEEGDAAAQGGATPSASPAAGASAA